MTRRFLRSEETIAASQAECYVTINGRRYNFFIAQKLEATVEKNKTELAILGKTGKGNKSTGWTGTGTLTIYSVTSLFRKMIKEYKDTGKDVYFEIQCINEDKTSSIGRQDVMLKGCNLDKVMLANFDADGDYLSEDMDFTFDDFEISEEFDELEGM